MIRIISLLGIGGAAALSVSGVVALKWYIWDIAIGQAEQADRSMLFWGLPILFLGMVLIAAGIGLARAVRRALVRNRAVSS